MDDSTRTGRPLRSNREPKGAAVKQEAVTNAITYAFFHEWARVGFSALALEKVAKKAHVGKASIYRRWPSKLEMASDLIAQEGIRLAQAVDTGDLETDIKHLLHEFRVVFRHPVMSRVIPDLHAEMARNADFSEIIRSNLQAKRRGAGRGFLEKAIARGDISSGINIEMTLDLMVSLIYWKMIILQKRVNNKYLEDLSHLIFHYLKNSS